MCSPGMQVTQLAIALDNMEARAARRAHRVRGSLAIEGKLLRRHILGERVGQEVQGAAEVLCSDSASIRRGTCVVRTKGGSGASGRTKCDHFAYIPFSSGRAHNACVLKIEQIVLVHKQGMGWADDEARLAVGILYDRLPARSGAGLESSYNDELADGACVVPRALFLSARRKKEGYRYAVHLCQINCSCSVLSTVHGDTFLTSSKMSFHGRKDLQHVDAA